MNKKIIVAGLVASFYQVASMRHRKSVRKHSLRKGIHKVVLGSDNPILTESDVVQEFGLSLKEWEKNFIIQEYPGIASLLGKKHGGVHNNG